MRTNTDNSGSLDDDFREAVAAIDSGDVVELERLVAANPALVRERLASPGAWLRETVGGALDGFFQRPYLLWFVAEDPVRHGSPPILRQWLSRSSMPPGARGRRLFRSNSTTR